MKLQLRSIPHSNIRNQISETQRPLSRRNFLRTAGATAAGISLAGPLLSWSKPPIANKTGIQHVVLVMMENRSFDHFLGWLPGAAGQQTSSYPDKAFVPRPTFNLDSDYQGCSYDDP